MSAGELIDANLDEACGLPLELSARGMPALIHPTEREISIEPFADGEAIVGGRRPILFLERPSQRPVKAPRHRCVAKQMTVKKRIAVLQAGLKHALEIRAAEAAWQRDVYTRTRRNKCRRLRQELRLLGVVNPPAMGGGAA